MASSSPHEVERLVVRMMVDNEQYEKKFEVSEQTVVKTSENIEKRGAELDREHSRRAEQNLRDHKKRTEAEIRAANKATADAIMAGARKAAADDARRKAAEKAKATVEAQTEAENQLAQQAAKTAAAEESLAAAAEKVSDAMGGDMGGGGDFWSDFLNSSDEASSSAEELAGHFFETTESAWSIMAALRDTAEVAFQLGTYLSGVEKFNKMITEELEKQKELQYQIAVATQERFARQDFDRGLLSQAEIGPALQDDLQALQTEIKASESALGRLQARFDEVNTLQFNDAIYNTQLTTARANLEAQEEQMGLLIDRRKELNEQLRQHNALMEKAASDRAARAIEEEQKQLGSLIERYSDQIETFHMNTRAAEIYRLEKQNADKAIVKYIKGLDEELTKLEQEKKAKEDAERASKKLTQQLQRESEQRQKAGQSLIENLERQIATHGMTSAEVAIYRAHQKGASKADLERARALQEQLAQMQEHAKMMKEGRRIIEQNMTPQQRYNEKVGDLNSLLEVGAIDAKTHARAVEKELNKLREGLDIEPNTSGIKAMRADSKQLIFDMQSHQNKLKELVQNEKLIPEDGEAARMIPNVDAPMQPGKGEDGEVKKLLTQIEENTAPPPGGMLKLKPIALAEV